MTSVSREEAIRIASGRLKDPAARRSLACLESRPPQVHLYLTTKEDCWYMFAPWEDGRDGTMLRSSRIILVGKVSGKIHYDGCAHDEG